MKFIFALLMTAGIAQASEMTLTPVQTQEGTTDETVVLMGFDVNGAGCDEGTYKIRDQKVLELNLPANKVDAAGQKKSECTIQIHVASQSGKKYIWKSSAISMKSTSTLAFGQKAQSVLNVSFRDGAKKSARSLMYGPTKNTEKKVRLMKNASSACEARSIAVVTPSVVVGKKGTASAHQVDFSVNLVPCTE